MSLLPVGFGASGDDAYEITDSLRFRSSASAYLSRTPASAGNRRTWTLSWWAKRGLLGSTGFTVFSAGTSASDTGELVIKYDNNYPDALAIQTGSTNIRFTNALYRDPSAWHHVVVAFDTTQSTASNRTKVYVNGEQITSFNISNDLTQNTDTSVNNTVTQEIGVFARLNSQYFDGYLTEVQMIDGQQLDADDFGEYDDNGTWKAKKYTGTYGTNGFYLNGVGVTDQSGNGNNWTNNNLNLSTSTATTYDQMKDTPSLVDENAANFATLNPLDVYPGRQFALDGNLKWNDTSGGSWGRSNMSVTTGKWYWEVSGFSTNNWMIGVSDGTKSITNSYAYYSGAPTALVYLFNGTTYIAGANAAFTSAFATTDIVGFVVDADVGSLAVYKNNVLQGTITGLSYGSYSPMVGPPAAGSCVFNFGQRPLTYTPPTGSKKLNTFNLPDSAVEDGSEYFNTVLYTAASSNGTYQITGNGFQPDFSWVKNRDNVERHLLFDSVRGNTSMTNKFLVTSDTSAEGANGVTGTTVTANADGMQVVETSINSGELYFNSRTYVMWNWKANGSGVSNTVGSINSTVSVNTTAGFSIVGYTGNGTNGATVGHGLGAVPDAMIIKNRDRNGAWAVYHSSLGATKYMQLDTNQAFTDATSWNNTSPTSTVFSLGTASSVNHSGEDLIAYCFSEVEGYSSFGSYTGNGNSEGTFIYTGFRPAFVIFKSSNQVTNWMMFDSTINPINEAKSQLWPNLTNAENTNSTGIDFVSNGIKLRGALTATNAATSYNYIYMAFAENPFKNSNAR